MDKNVYQLLQAVEGVRRALQRSQTEDCESVAHSLIDCGAADELRRIASLARAVDRELHALNRTVARLTREVSMAGEDALLGRTVKRIVNNNALGDDDPQDGVQLTLLWNAYEQRFQVEVDAGESTAVAQANALIVAVVAAGALDEGKSVTLYGREEVKGCEEDATLPEGWDDELVMVLNHDASLATYFRQRDGG